MSFHGAAHARSIDPRRDAPTNTVGSAFQDVDLNHSGALGIITSLQDQGFRLCALMPGMAQTQGGPIVDRARLVRTPSGVQIDWSLIELEAQVQVFADWMRSRLFTT